MTAQDEEHLLGSEVHMHPHPRRVGGQFVQRCSHPGVVRPPEESMPRTEFFVVSVPYVGKEVLTIHSWYLRVVAVDAQPREPAGRASKYCAGNARLLAAPTATLPPDPRQDHAWSRMLTTAQRSRRVAPTRSRTLVARARRLRAPRSTTTRGRRSGRARALWLSRNALDHLSGVLVFPLQGDIGLRNDADEAIVLG